jgi:hypothetical protein
MKKLLISSLLITTTLLAFQAEVTQDDIVVEVNGQLQNYKVGSNPRLHQGGLVCYESGDGVLHITADNYDEKISKEGKNCKLLPNDNNQTTNTTLAQDKYVNLLGDMRGAAIDGFSIRSGSLGKVDKAPIIIKSSDKYLHIKSKVWSPRTITIKIIDKEGKVIAKDANRHDSLTSFIFPTNILKDGYRVNVTDGFGGVLMDSRVTVK